MPLQLVRKPPIGNARNDRLKITLAGNHTLKQKTSMLLQVKFWLHHEQGIDNAGPSDLYLSLLDPNGYPLTTFRDGQAMSDYSLVIESPYPCAADDYDRRHSPPVLRPF
jgi:hypothetical protein